MAYSVSIEGVSEMLKAFNDSPKEIKKASKKALKDACNQEKSILKYAVPEEGLPLIKSWVGEARSGNVLAYVGLFMDKAMDETGRKGPEWYHMYWKNYGTLLLRDPAHRFSRGIRQGVKRRNNRGQMHENFYERATSGISIRVLSAFKRSMKQQGYELK